VVLIFLLLQDEFSTLRFSMQPSKCVLWSPHRLDQFISFPPSFLTSNSSFCILGTFVGFGSFIKLFVAEAHHKDLDMIFSFLMFANL
jgi:hypothetical protein